MKDKTTTKKGKKAAKSDFKKKVAKSLTDSIKLAKGTPIQKETNKPFNKNKKFDKSKSNKPSDDKTKQSYKPKANFSKKPVKKMNSKYLTSANGGRQGSKKMNSQLVEILKTQWNQLRNTNNVMTEDDKVEIIDKLLKDMKNRILDVTLRHDASRIVQCILQYGNKRQRHEILIELCKKAADIAKTPYGHFTILKAVNYCLDRDEQELLYKAFIGHYLSLSCNAIGARTTECLFISFPNEFVNHMKAEIYGKKFTVFLTESNVANLTSSLKSILIHCPNNKYFSILDHMHDILHRFINKSLLDFQYVHLFLYEYALEVMKLDKNFDYVNTDKDTDTDYHSSEATEETKLTQFKRRIADLINSLIEFTPKLLSTKMGSKLVCILISYSNAKEKKIIIKSIKGKVLESVCHPTAHLGIMRMIDATDDTVFVQKSILNEISSLKPPTAQYTPTGDLIDSSVIPPLVQVAMSPYGRKVLSRILTPQSNHIELDEIDYFQEGVMVNTSFKAAAQKRKEHLVYLSQPLINLCARYAEELMTDVYGSKVFMGVVGVFYPTKVLKNVSLLFNDLPIEAEDGFDEEVEMEVDSEEEYDEDSEDEEQGDGEEEREEEEVEVESMVDEEEEEEEVVVETISKPKLPLQEDPIAHTVMKYIIDLQVVAEYQTESADTVNSAFATATATTTATPKKKTPTKKAPKTPIKSGCAPQTLLITTINHKEPIDPRTVPQDRSHWQQVILEDDTFKYNYFNFTRELIQTGIDNENISTWCGINRACYILLSSIKVPSVRSMLISNLKPVLKDTKLSGAKLLKEHL